MVHAQSGQRGAPALQVQHWRVADPGVLHGAWANESKSVWNITGPVFVSGEPKTWLESDSRRVVFPIAIPDSLFKVVARKTAAGWEATRAPRRLKSIPSQQAQNCTHAHGGAGHSPPLGACSRGSVRTLRAGIAPLGVLPGQQGRRSTR